MDTDKDVVITENQDRHLITDKELSECDREQLHLIGTIQDGVGHVFFFSHPMGEVLALDVKIMDIPWIRNPIENTDNDDDDNDDHDNATSTETSEDYNDDDDGDEENTDGPNMNKRQKIDASLEGCHQSKSNVEKKKGFETVHPKLMHASQLLGKNIERCIPKSLMQDIVQAIDTMKKGRSQRSFRFFSYQNENFAISVSTTTNDFSLIGVEVECVEDFEDTGDFYNTLVSLGRVMEFYADEKMLGTACNTVFELLKQYDRGMVYQFKDDLSGEVVHEIKKDWLDTSYLGMRFPASDIPLTARKLFVMNKLRYIYNVNSECSPLIDNGLSRLDLSHCRMRAVSRSHIVYLRNMGVISSLSISIVVNGKLWGLFAFHAYREAFKPSLHQRIVCESIMTMVSVKVESLVRKAESSRIIDLSKSLMRWEQIHSVAYNLSNLSKYGEPSLYGIEQTSRAHTI